MCGTAKARDFEGDPLLGAVIAGRYVIQERIGHGASGTIYRGEHTTLHRKVAVKVLHEELSRDELAIERFRRAATTVSEVDNDHIVAIHDFGRTDDGRLYLAMELLEGETLHEVLERERHLPIDRVVDILTQLGEALMEAHAMGYIHRDLRPRNIFLSRRRGQSNYVKILDFGLAKLVEKEGEAASTSLGMTFGDPRYMSPEQARGDPVDRRADIYSLGCIAYEMIVGDAPFTAPKVFEVLTAHLEKPPTAPLDRRPDCPSWLNAAVLCSLAKKADERFITVYRFVEALRDGSSTGEIMSMDKARRRETLQPESVTRTLNKFGLDSERAPSAPIEGDTVEDTAPSKAPSFDDEDDEDIDGRKTIPVGKGKSARVQAPSSGGISQAWYADGEALEEAVEDGASESQIRTKLRRPAVGSSDTGLMAYEDEFDDGGRRRIMIAAAVVVLLLAIGIGFAMSRGGSDGDEPAPDEAAGPVAKTVIDAGVAAAAVTPDAAPAPRPPDRIVKKPPPDRIVKKPPPDRIVEKPPPDRIVEKPPPANRSQADFYAKLGKKQLRDGDVLGAAGNFKKARELDARNVDAIVGMGEIALTQGHNKHAIAHLKKAAGLRPRSARVHSLLGEAYLAAGRNKQAAAAFKKALKIDPDNNIARNGYNEAIGSDPDDSDELQ
jgi:serine/threonine protein kinase